MTKDARAKPSIWAVLLLAASVAFLLLGISLLVFR